jgi:uncharacterized delta-60 repeat protein
MQKYSALLVALSVFSLLHADGVLDTTFGAGLGYITMPVGFFASGIAIQPDTKILVTGSSTTNTFQIVRYNNDGSFDLNFNTISGTISSCCMGGIGQTGPVGVPFSVCLQSDGSSIVVGQDVSGSNFQLAKYTSSGFLDTTYGTNGVVVGPTGYAIDGSIQIDGRVVAVGTDISGHLLVVRYNANGSIASTFNVGAFGFAESIQVQYDGKIVIAGTNNAGNMQIIRYTSTGLVDTSFGTNGVVTGPAGVATALLIQPNGFYVITGYGLGLNPHMLAARYTHTGALDVTFGVGGIVTGPVNFLATCSALQSDGKIVIGGEGSSNIKLTRYTSTGMLDATFGVAGVVTGTIGDVFGLALQSNGYIVTVGLDPTATYFQVARYTGNSPMVASVFTSANVQQTGAVTITGATQNPSQVYLYVDSELVYSTFTDTVANSWTAPLTTILTFPGLYTMRAISFYKDANLLTATMDELRVYGNKII